ncbi:hypothetical protein DFH11DRAFT_1596584 [Phellopilus nigrolimitatus]|nr:hypothetical protein DFH11DRAFT_1596584 [Phellopilus nigrolimitatus]
MPIQKLLLAGCLGLSASSSPLRRIHLRQLSPVQVTWVTSSITASFEATTTAIDIVTLREPANSLDQIGGAETPFLVAPPSSSPPDSVSISIATSTATLSELLTATIYEPPKTVTLTAAPTTVTDTITVSETFVATPGSFWAAPERFSDLDSFKISHFACGEKNLQITQGVPANASDQSLAVGLANVDDLEYLYDEDDSANNSSVLQLFYPANSINPENSPQGGADFYATPLPLDGASNVTLEYSVYFPAGFDWVYGGKLPGLYGGHMTCSGGDSATSCFSTRMMWRNDGAGELYLYAPKDKQTDALCNAPPESVCDAAYGLSVGRGSFRFTPGAWTRVRQTVSLNTPGKQDGGFRLEVDGRLIMDRKDVFYRDVPSTTTTSPSPTSTDTDGDADDGGLLSPLIGGVLPPLGVNGSGFDSPVADSLPLQQPFSGPPATNTAVSSVYHNLLASRLDTMPATVTQMAPQSTVTIASYLWADVMNGAGKVDASQDTTNAPEPVGFSGLFFSTFFGGSSEKYATPIDQYTWFKDFVIIINS